MAEVVLIGSDSVRVQESAATVTEIMALAQAENSPTFRLTLLDGHAVDIGLYSFAYTTDEGPHPEALKLRDPKGYARLIEDNERKALPQRIRNVRASIKEWRGLAKERRTLAKAEKSESGKAAYEAKAQQHETDIARAEAWLKQHAKK